MGETKKPTRYTLLIDLDKCTGCQACSVACKMENNVDLGVFLNRVARMGPVGEFPDKLEMFFFPNQCMHCEIPTCVEVCPTKATYQTDTGVVLVDKDLCFGCQYCVWACPYDARTLNPKTKMVEKCTLCIHLLEKGEQPMCVYTCTTQARCAGDINDPDSEISRILAANKDRQFKIHPELRNSPSVIYLAPRKGAETLCQSLKHS